MALPWFKVATSLPAHPKLLELAAAIPGLDPLGAVVRLWAWTASYYPNGKIPAKLQPQLEQIVTGYVTATGVVTAMIEVGLIEKHRDSLIVHDWDIEQGEHVNMQERNRAKQQAYRERNRLRNREVTGGVTGSEERRGEEIRKEDLARSAEQPADAPPVVSAQVEVPAAAPPTTTTAPPAAKPEREAATPAQKATRQAIKSAFEAKHAQANTGVPFPWSAKENKHVKLIATACGDDAQRALAVLRSALAEPFLAARFIPSFVSGQVAPLIQRKGDDPPARSGARQHVPLVVTPETYANDPDDMAAFQEKNHG